MRRLPVVLALLSPLALTACGSSTSSAPSPSSTAPAAPVPSISGSASADPQALAQVQSYCDHLASGAQVDAAAGTPMGTVAVQSVQGTPGCRWDAADESGVSIELVNASSSTWAAQLPQIASDLRAGGTTLDAALTRQLATAAAYVSRGQEVDADLACEIFTGFAEATGARSGADSTVRVVPTTAAPQAITGQACSGDEYSFAQLTAPDLADDLPTHLRALEGLLQHEHGAPLHVDVGQD